MRRGLVDVMMCSTACTRTAEMFTKKVSLQRQCLDDRGGKRELDVSYRVSPITGAHWRTVPGAGLVESWNRLLVDALGCRDSGWLLPPFSHTSGTCQGGAANSRHRNCGYCCQAHDQTGEDIAARPGERNICTTHWLFC
jgi:hypothetical protein